MLIINSRAEKGFSLVELLVGLAAGLTLLSGVIGIFSATVGSTGYNLKMTRVNQELRTVMDLMARDIRRAGYWGKAVNAGRPSGKLTPSAQTGAVTLTSTQNAFAPFGAQVAGLSILTGSGSALISRFVSNTTIDATVVRDFASLSAIEDGYWMISNPFTSVANVTDIAVSTAQTCIQYTYDRNGDSVVDANEQFGFRLNRTTLEIHKGGAIDCTTGTGDWEAITNDTIEITTLRFDNSDSRCINLSNGSTNCTPGAADYVAPGAGDVLEWIRQIDITLSGRSVSNNEVARTLIETVRVRNDRITVN